MDHILHAPVAMTDGGTRGIAVDVQNGEAVLSMRDIGVGLSEVDMCRSFDPALCPKNPSQGAGLDYPSVAPLLRRWGQDHSRSSGRARHHLRGFSVVSGS